MAEYDERSRSERDFLLCFVFFFWDVSGILERFVGADGGVTTMAFDDKFVSVEGIFFVGVDGAPTTIVVETSLLVVGFRREEDASDLFVESNFMIDCEVPVGSSC